jgi:dipeptidyl aminopeptidase/acylaminoacyl peptidase
VVAVGGCSALVEYDVLPGRSKAYNLLGLTSDKAPVPQAEAGPRVDGRFGSSARGTEVGWTVAYPPGSATTAELPVVVALHAGHGDHTTVFDGGLFMDRFLALAVADGVAPFAIASVDGADSWRTAPDGTGAGGMVTGEFLPLLADRGLDTDRLAYLGWSMGGYGALLLGATTTPPVRAVVATSPALVEGSTAARYDVYRMRDAWAEIPLRIDIGRGDPFYRDVMDFEDGVHPRPAGRVTLGSHTHDYWRAAAPEQLRWLGDHLHGHG